jgi:hypothetical protein
MSKDKKNKIDCDELAEMSKEELSELLVRLGDNEDTTLWDEQELLDHIIETYAMDCFERLHSEGRDEDYSSLHPDETTEEFEDHEDNEPRD